MPTNILCQSCRKQISAPDGSEGKQVRCPYCQSHMRVPSGFPSRIAVSEFAPEKTIPVAFWLAAASLIVSGVAVIIMFLPIYGWLAVVFAFIAFGLAIMSDRVAAYQNTPGKLPAIAVAFTLAIFVIALGLTINALNRLNDVRERF